MSSLIGGAAVMPPKWSLGYMQSHRELVDKNLTSEQLILNVVDTFREKKIPLDAVIYLGTGFTPTGWNTRQPSFKFNPRVFQREPKGRARRPAREERQGDRPHGALAARSAAGLCRARFPRQAGRNARRLAHRELLAAARRLVNAGVDAWWPDEGDWFNLFERIKRHQLYYQGPLSTRPNERPWSLHRNGHLGVAQWGGWVWSGDTQSTWKTLEGQIAVGINHSLSLSPYWGSDTGGFYTTSRADRRALRPLVPVLGVLPVVPLARPHLATANCPGAGASATWASREGQNDPPAQSEMNNPTIEPICRKYAELRYQLIPYTYTLAAEARDTGMPFMRAMWLHYPNDEKGPRPGHAVSVGPRHARRPGLHQGRDHPRRLSARRRLVRLVDAAKSKRAARRSPARSIWQRCRSTSAPARSFRSIRCGST